MDVSMNEVEGSEPLGSERQGNDRKKWWTTLVANLASTIEKADEQVVPSMYTYVGRSFGCSVKDLGVLTSSRALSQALASPFAGLAGYRWNRVKVLAAGCFIWGLMTMGFGLVKSLHLGVVLWAMNGIGLSFVIPSTQSLMADYFDEASRGKAFGALSFTAAIGALGAIMYATNAGAGDIAGLEGWRFVLFSLSFVSGLIGVLTLLVAHDPRDEDNEVDSRRGKKLRHSFEVRTVLRDVWTVLKLPSFILIVVQGIFGSFPWQALAYMTHYLQLIGMSNFEASALLATFHTSSAFGGILGGLVGDYIGTKYPNHGRIFTCQMSVGIKLPLVYIILKCLPMNGESGTFWMYATSLGLMGCLGAWAASACNNPIFAEIVPETHRNLVYGFDRSFEGAIAALGAPLVGIVAEKYGYTGAVEVTGNPSLDLPNGRALGKSMFFLLMMPWSMCLFLYSFLHWSYPRDRDNANKAYMPLPSKDYQENKKLLAGSNSESSELEVEA